MYHVLRGFLKNGYGSRVLLTGLNEALLSRLTFLTVRNTFYKIVYDIKKPKKLTNDLTHNEKAVLSGIAGSLGALVSNYFEIQLI